MKYIKLFEENEHIAFNKKFFTPLVDWKFFDLMKDYCLEYEDKGIEMTCSFGVFKPSDNVNVTGLYYSPLFSDEYNEWEVVSAEKHLLKYYKQDGLWYNIRIEHKSQDGDDEILMNIIKRLKNKYNLIYKYSPNWRANYAIRLV